LKKKRESKVAALSAPQKINQPAKKKYFSIFFYIYSISTQYWLPSLKMTK